MGAADATLNQGMGLTPEEYRLMSHSPRPIEASAVGSHVKSTPETIWVIVPIRILDENHVKYFGV